MARIQGDRRHSYHAARRRLAAAAAGPWGREYAAQAKATLVGAGYQEIIAYSLVDDGQNQRLDSRVPWPAPPTAEGMVALYNYMSVDHAYLRTTLLGSLLETLAANLRHRDRAFLFELACVYYPPLEPLPTEATCLALVSLRAA